VEILSPSTRTLRLTFAFEISFARGRNRAVRTERVLDHDFVSFVDIGAREARPAFRVSHGADKRRFEILLHEESLWWPASFEIREGSRPTTSSDDAQADRSLPGSVPAGSWSSLRDAADVSEKVVATGRDPALARLRRDVSENFRCIGGNLHVRGGAPLYIRTVSHSGGTEEILVAGSGIALSGASVRPPPATPEDPVSARIGSALRDGRFVLAGEDPRTIAPDSSELPSLPGIYVVASDQPRTSASRVMLGAWFMRTTALLESSFMRDLFAADAGALAEWGVLANIFEEAGPDADSEKDALFEMQLFLRARIRLLERSRMAVEFHRSLEKFAAEHGPVDRTRLLSAADALSASLA
jgi:hypothetical protein